MSRFSRHFGIPGWNQERLTSLLKPDEHLLTWGRPTPGTPWTRSIRFGDTPKKVRPREPDIAPKEMPAVIRPGRPDRCIEPARGGHR